MTDDRRILDQRREQEVADRALRELLAGLPCPDLPPRFTACRSHRPTLAPACRPLGATTRIILLGYWVVTAMVGAAMVARIAWPASLSPVVAVGAGVSVAATLLPMLLYGRCLRDPLRLLGRGGKGR